MCPFPSKSCSYGTEHRATHSRGPRTWLVRISLGRDSETGTENTTTKPFETHPRSADLPSGKLQERKSGRLPRAAAISLNQYLDQWLTAAAKPRLRPKSYTDYEVPVHCVAKNGILPRNCVCVRDVPGSGKMPKSDSAPNVLPAGESPDISAVQHPRTPLLRRTP
jgi:hypothetical protein